MFDQDYLRRFIAGTVAGSSIDPSGIYRSDTDRSDTGYVYVLGVMRANQSEKKDGENASRWNRETGMS